MPEVSEMLIRSPSAIALALGLLAACGWYSTFFVKAVRGGPVAEIAYR